MTNLADLRVVENELLSYALRFQCAHDTSPGWIDYATRQMVEAINDAAPGSHLADSITDLLHSKDFDKPEGNAGASLAFRMAADVIAGWLVYDGRGSGVVIRSQVEHDCCDVPRCRIICTPEAVQMWTHWRPNTIATFVTCALCGAGRLQLETGTSAGDLAELGAVWITNRTDGHPTWTNAEIGAALAMFKDDRKLDGELAGVMRKWSKA